MLKKIVIVISVISVSFLCFQCTTENTSEPADLVNNPPEITSLSATPDVVGLSDSTVLICNATDPDGDNLKYVWQASSGLINGSGDSVIWQAPDSTGISTINCTVKDGHGGEDSEEITVEVEYQIPTDGLIAWWPFNGNANDESGDGHDGTVHGAVLAKDRFGNENCTYHFDGIDDYIEFNPQKNTTEFSVSAWFNMKSHVGWDNTIIAQDYSPSNRHITLLTKNNKIEWHRYNSTDNLPNIFSKTEIQDNIWYHVIITVHENRHIMYVNGVYEGTSIDDFQMISTMPIRIGRYNSGHYPFHGSIDDVLIYSRALTDVEVKALYHQGGWNN